MCPKSLRKTIAALNSPVIFVICLLFAVSACKKEQGFTNRPPQSNGPNIIFFLADDYGYEIPGFDGGQSYSTPNLDALAANGMRFTQCYSSPLCSPSRVSLLTGKYNFRNYTAWGQLGLDQKTFANMLYDAGYSTCIAGKWQFEGGGDTITHFGFEHYCLWNIIDEADDKGSRYKSPLLYEDGHYLPDDSTANKYSEDIFTNYITSFIKNRDTSRSFFIYFPFCLTHNPFSPTPDDPEYATWDPDQAGHGDTVFFPSMVRYMDKKIGEIIRLLDSLGLKQNTAILFTGDNGTSTRIHSLLNGQIVEGGKALTTQAGTHVPLFAYWPGKIAPSVNNNLVDFTDILPTLAGIAGIPEPTNYGTLDGLSFYPQLINEQNAAARSWAFCHFAPHSGDIPVRFIWNSVNKYYEDGRFYDMGKDILEQNPIPPNKLTTQQLSDEINFKTVLSGLSR